MKFVDKLLDRTGKVGYYAENERYGNMEELKSKIINKRISYWDTGEIRLEDGTSLTLETSEQDCCAGAGGSFSNVTLDAMITDVKITEMEGIPDSDTIINKVEVFIFHNQNIIAQADMEADAGNGGYYYSIGSIVINDVHFPIVEA